jgi:hypothetical protein
MEPVVRGMAQDITERNRAEERIRKGFRQETALLRINTQILEGGNSQGALGSACEAIVEMGYRMCWTPIISFGRSHSRDSLPDIRKISMSGGMTLPKGRVPQGPPSGRANPA